MRLRQMATAFINCGGKFAMMKKTPNKLFDFEFWTALGGHLESDEISDPRKACLREVFEESGLLEKDLSELTLRYVLLRQKDDEIRIQYVFFGNTNKSQLIASDEGKPVWVDEKEIKELKISTIIREMLEHYRDNPNPEAIFIGTLTSYNEDKPTMLWSEMKDPLVF
jgi:8-oxo-dGTP diphosphatase